MLQRTTSYARCATSSGSRQAWIEPFDRLATAFPRVSTFGFELRHIAQAICALAKIRYVDWKFPAWLSRLLSSARANGLRNYVPIVVGKLFPNTPIAWIYTSN